jgi:flagellar hook assembly protein FlgD
MATKNDVTGDSIQTKVSSKAYLDNYDAIFGKNQKMKQKELTELNWDGNEDRGRYGEDESKQDKVSSGTV